MRRAQTSALAALLFVFTGCAATSSSKQLLDARLVVARASDGQAAKFAPDDLLEARQLLQKAENAKDGSEQEIQFAYLADREARRAEVRGKMLYQTQETAKMEAEFAALQESGRLSAVDRLEKSRRDLAEVEARLKDRDADVDSLSRKREQLLIEQAQLSSNLNTSVVALAASEKARQDADARAAAAIASLASLANIREEGNETIITLSGQVLFTTGSSTLLPIAKDSLGRVARALGDISSDRPIVVKGHTDSQGENAANQRLSEDRAKSVMNFLVSAGVAASRLSAVGLGEGDPVAPNDTPEGRANNRRVELVIGGRSTAATARGPN